MSWALIPVSNASSTKPPTRINDTRLAMVIVKRSLDAAKAIMAGNNVNPITSVNMARTRSHLSPLSEGIPHSGALNAKRLRSTTGALS